MSGPKRGTWYFSYDPTPARLNDLSYFATKQDAWLTRHRSFICRYLGNEAFVRAQAARNIIDDYIDEGNPDDGFDAYGDAWNLFNQLYREASRAKQLEQQRKRQEQLKQQHDATKISAECKALWKDQENQILLLRWVTSKERNGLVSALQAVGQCPAHRVQAAAQAWRRSFDCSLKAANSRAQENAKAVAASVPHLRSAVQMLGKLNLSALADDEQKIFASKKQCLQENAEDDLANEKLEELRSAIQSLNDLAAEYQRKIRFKQFHKATTAVQQALSRCGFSVTSRTENNGTTVFQASGFPFKALSVEMNPATDEMRLDVGSKCVTDVQSLQAELSRLGLVLKMTDWGKGNPQGVQTDLGQKIVLGDKK